MKDSLRIRNQEFAWGQRTYIMGILNVTPDSFSDGGQFDRLDTAIHQALEMIKQGADIIDIGGQSTRPGAKQITLTEELNRVIPIVESLRKQSDIVISVDTTRSEVAQSAIDAGADIINDISGATFDPEILGVAARMQAPIILMHIRGNPETMQTMTDYDDIVSEIKTFLQSRVDRALELGIKKEHLILDIGIGFAKDLQQNITILRNISEFKKMGFPLLIGTSRKSFIGKILNQKEPKQRIWGTAGSCSYAITQGADILRVHDVGIMSDVAKVTDALSRMQNTEYQNPQ